MSFRLFSAILGVTLAVFATASQAADDDCRKKAPRISFVQFRAPVFPPSAPPAPPASLTIKAKLTLPTHSENDKLCVNDNKRWPAVVILHDSLGVDARGDFYTEALSKSGIATLQIDMWEARGVTSIANRPPAPIFTYPDAFAALAFLSAHPNILPNRIGVLGFSWGGVISLAAAERVYADMFGGGLRFAAHVANYPVCYGANNTLLFPRPIEGGARFETLTGAPVLIQIGSKDDYDNGTAHCRRLAQSVNRTNNNVVEVAEYPGAYHAWDRLGVPLVAPDPFANEGSFFKTGVMPLVRIVPDVAQAYESRERVARFFKRNL